MNDDRLGTFRNVHYCYTMTYLKERNCNEFSIHSPLLEIIFEGFNLTLCLYFKFKFNFIQASSMGTTLVF